MRTLLILVVFTLLRLLILLKTALITLFLLFELLYTACTVSCMPLPIYTVREGKNAIGMGSWTWDEKVGWVSG